VRVVAVLSPTRPAALAGASALQLLLMEFADLPILVQVVWEPQEETDWGAARRLRCWAGCGIKRVKQYWDKERKASKEMGAGAGAGVFAGRGMAGGAAGAGGVGRVGARSRRGRCERFSVPVTPPAETRRSASSR
jgi:hypothetical protein